MVKDAKILRQHGADGFVFGALLPNGDVDMKKCHEIVKACFPLPVTFHRAFDFCRRPTIEIEVVIDLGFTRVLTSGKQKTALIGSKLIAKLMEQVSTTTHLNRTDISTNLLFLGWEQNHNRTGGRYNEG